MPVQMNVPANPANPVMLEYRAVCQLVEEDTTTQEIVNVFHLAGRSSNPGMLNLANVGNGMSTLLGGQLGAVFSDQYTGALADIRIMDDPTLLPVGAGTPWTGTVTGDRLPSFAAVSVDLVTDGRGRCFRGRKHFAPIAESDTSTDELTAGAITNWTNALNAIAGGFPITDGAGNSFDLVVLSRINSNLIGPGVYFTYAPFVSFRLSHKLGTMRRRKEGVGA